MLYEVITSILRGRHIDWICNAKVEKFADGAAHVVEVDEDGNSYNFV